jgi:hypothetical protein
MDDLPPNKLVFFVNGRKVTLPSLILQERNKFSHYLAIVIVLNLCCEARPFQNPASMLLD